MLVLLDNNKVAYANNGYTGEEDPNIAVKSEAVYVIYKRVAYLATYLTDIR